MLRSFLHILAAFCFIAFQQEQAQAQTPAPAPVQKTDAEIFGQIPFLSWARLSPNGDRIIMMQNFRGKKTLVTKSLVNPKARAHIIPFSQGEFRWAKWASDDRILVSIKFAGKRYGTETTETRLVSMTWDGKDALNLFKAKKENEFRLRKLDNLFPQFQDDVIDLLRDDPDHILVAYDNVTHGEPGVFKVNILTGDKSILLKPRRYIQDWVTDHNHQVRYGTGARSTVKGLVTKAFYRKTVKSSWKKLFEYDDVTGGSPFNFIGFSNRPEIIYIGKVDENGREAFYEYNVDLKKIVRKIAGSDEYDIESLSINEKGEIKSYVYYGTKRVVTHLDQDEAKLFKIFTKSFPDEMISIESRSKDEKVILVRVTAPTMPNSFYLLNLRKKSFTEFSFNYGDLDVDKLSPMKPVTYKARDGLEIHGYLSVPFGKEAKNLPTIIMPHGGPMSRDRWGFDYEVQFLTAKGYAVLQMNYRGSTGYGNEFYQRGYHEWGGKMIDDINDGTKWMIEQGYSNPKRICIMGSSYGGYAALQGVVKDPSLYKCSVAFAPLTDLKVFLRHKRKFINTVAYRKYITSNDWTIEEGSPADNIDKINIPVLLVHGDNDRIVRVKQSRIFRTKMRRKNKNLKYIEFKGGDHHLSNQKHRINFLSAVETFLEKHL